MSDSEVHMSDTVKAELEPWAHTGLNWCRNRSSRVITQSMLQKLTPPGGYHCVLPPIMSAEEESRIVNAALATYKGRYEVTIPYIEVVKTDPTLPFRPRNREQAEQMARLLKERNTALEKASKDCAARKARFLARQAERAQAVRDRMLRDHQKEQKVVIKKQKHLKSKPNINITQTSQPPLNWMRYRDMLDDLNKRRVSLEPEMRQKRIDEFKWQKVQSGIHWPGYEPSENKPVGKLTPIAMKAEKVGDIKKQEHLKLCCMARSTGYN